MIIFILRVCAKTAGAFLADLITLVERHMWYIVMA